ncbi:MAG: stalk domain-containing protein, partial [Armatimonadota bacterium]
AQSIRGRVMVPLRFVAEGFGAWVDYKQRQITLTLAQENKKAVMATPPHPNSHLGKIHALIEYNYDLRPLPKREGVHYPHVELLLSKRYRQELLEQIGELGPVEHGWNARGLEGIRVERDHYDGGSKAWADVMVLYGPGEAERERLTFVKEATGWKLDGVKWDQKEEAEGEDSD